MSRLGARIIISSVKLSGSARSRPIERWNCLLYTSLASAGAQCNHIDHVSTQIPYALMVAVFCFIGYLVGGFCGNGFVALVVGVILLFCAILVISAQQKKRAQN